MLLKTCMLLFITAGPSVIIIGDLLHICALGGGQDSRGHVLLDATNLGLCGP